MKTVVIEGKDLLFTLFKLAFYIWIEMWNVRILLVAVKMVIAVGGYSTYLAVILVSAYGICSAYRGLKKTVAKTIRRWLFFVQPGKNWKCPGKEQSILQICSW